jgi:hypothetical protein
VREHAPGHVDGLASVGRLADHVHVVLGTDERGEAASHGSLVVGDDDADHAPARA